ncbi:AAA family ATPase [Kibdelosporangium persicum]|uniref:Helix-turn-helix transcriptional regulator n=1 Tax=Kibdelosporangium persicum TaxID=2698649 RepID=A0ABX2FA26_9PSEU|nr:AAA family ATPase [Kibdelosporangium persicum]NRN67620.1 Helix-turn-helix transcriptional regulator [Kibdelosporangium persicum]
MKSQVIGRDPELAALARALDRPGGTILLRGQAGIGKSALAQHALELAAAQGLTVLRGQAHPLHAGLAYAPIVEAIRPFADALPDEGIGELLASRQTPIAPLGGDPDLNRTRMFEAVTRLVQHLAPAVFFVDDLHWADRGTIELVHYLGRNTERVLVLAAYRPGEANPALDDLAAAVRRTGTELALPPLTDDSVARLTGDLLGQTPAPSLLDNITRRAKGVPLFVTALVHSGLNRSGTVPVIVRDVVLDRLRMLTAPERRLVETVAVAGEAATSEVLAAVCDAPAVLKKLITAGLITEHTAGRGLAYRVAHPLYAEVAYAEMTLGDRRALHAAVIRAIERVHPDDVLTLAPHYREAGDLVDRGRAARIMGQAGWRALAMRAPDEAIRYLRPAAEIAAPEDVPVLLDGLGLAHQALGQFDAAVDAWTTGLVAARRHDLAAIAGKLRFHLAVLNAERQGSDAAVNHLAAEAAAIQPHFPEAAAHHFAFVMRHEQEADLRAVTTKMAALARPDRPSAAQAVGNLGAAIRSMLDGRFHAALAQAEQAVAQAELCEAEDPIHVQYTSLVLSPLRALTGNVSGAIDAALAAVRSPYSIETPTHTCYSRYVLSCARYLSGDIAAALRETDMALASAAELPRYQARVSALRAFLLAEQGKLTEASAVLIRAREVCPAPDLGAIEAIRLAEAVIAVHQDRPAEAGDFRFFSLFCDPYTAMMRPVFTRSTDALRAFGPEADLAIAVTDRDAERLESMGAVLFAAQTRLDVAERNRDSRAAVRALEVFERAGAVPWANRARRLARSLGVRIPGLRVAGPLSTRETDVVRLLAEGLSNADIAARLFLSQRTVETHLRNSYAKLGLGSRVALARWGAENLA